MIVLVKLFLFVSSLLTGFIVNLDHKGASVWYYYYDDRQQVTRVGQILLEDCTSKYTDVHVVTTDLFGQARDDYGIIRFTIGDIFPEIVEIPNLQADSYCHVIVVSSAGEFKTLQTRIFIVTFGNGIRNDAGGHPLPTYTPFREATSTPGKTPTPAPFRKE